MKQSFLTCKHKNVQQFTECCLDCGYNVYTTEKEYLADLRKQAGITEHTEEIRALEQRLKITQ
jgi:hypothetical protein